MNITLECGPGWKTIIESCYAELKSIDPMHEPLQIKEKFGVLRYYFSTNIDQENPKYNQLREVVWKYELESSTICELCGQPGQLTRQKYRVRTLCEECFLL